MKSFLSIIVLSLCFITPSYADDISDFQIEGISIGDSLLDYYSELDIKLNTRPDNYPKSNLMQRTQLIAKSKIYNTLNIYYKKNDKNYVVYSIRATMYIDTKKCKKKLKEISKEVSYLFPSIKVHKYRQKHQSDKSGKSIVTGHRYWLKNNSYIGVECYDWSLQIGKEDHLGISVASEEFQEFMRLNYE